MKKNIFNFIEISIGDATKYIWDTPEYENPPIENNAFFISTHQTITYDQTQGVCPTVR